MPVPCEPMVFLGVTTTKSNDCSLFAECIPVTSHTQTNSSYECNCKTSYDLLTNHEADDDKCMQTTGSWAVVAIHLLFVLVAVLIFVRMWKIVRKNLPRLQLISDALRLSLVATACLAVRCLMIAVRVSVLHGPGETIFYLLLSGSTVFLFFSFAISVVIYGLIVLVTLRQSHSMQSIKQDQKTLRKRAFRLAFAVATVICLLSGGTFAVGLHTISHTFVVVLGFSFVVLYSFSLRHLLRLSKEFNGRLVASNVIDTLRQTIVTIVACVTVFTVATVLFTVFCGVGYAHQQFGLLQEGRCIALFIEYVAMFLFQHSMAVAAEAVMQNPEGVVGGGSEYHGQHRPSNTSYSLKQNENRNSIESAGNLTPMVIVVNGATGANNNRSTNSILTTCTSLHSCGLSSVEEHPSTGVRSE